LSAPEREVTSPSHFKIVGALLHVNGLYCVQCFEMRGVC
jgi:hypothetical protein